MRREVADLIGSGLLLAGITLAIVATLAPPTGASVAASNGTSTSGSPLITRGQSLFHVKGCAGCHRHSVENPNGFDIGPDLTGLADRAATRKPGMSAEAYVRESIKTPKAFVVPGYESAGVGGTGMPDLGLTDDEIDAVVAFLLAPNAP